MESSKQVILQSFYLVKKRTATLDMELKFTQRSVCACVLQNREKMKNYNGPEHVIVKLARTFRNMETLRFSVRSNSVWEMGAEK